MGISEHGRLERREDGRKPRITRSPFQPFNPFNPPPLHPSTFLLSLVLALCLTACYEPKEGCLDLRARNFAVDADNACAGCCQYPALKLAVSHKVYNVARDTFYNLVYQDSVYQDGAGNNFRVQNIQFYISNLRFVRPDGTEVPTLDSLNIESTDVNGNVQEINVLDNFALVNRSTFTEFSMGTFIAEGKFSAIRFEVGIANPVNQTMPSSFLSGHPLANENMYVNADTGFIFNQLAWLNGANKTDTLVTNLNIATESFLRTIEVPLDISLIEGFDVILTLRVDYAQWFLGIDLKNDTPATLATKITDNLRNSFTVLAVDLE